MSTNQALNYSPSSGFNVTTVNGFGSIGGPINNFGRFSLGTFGSYTGQAFTLLITFIDPAANNNVFAASLTGSVRSTTSGGVFIDFDNTKQWWGSTPSDRRYSVQVNDLSVHPGENLAVSGNVTATPEPISMLLVGTGLAGLGVARRRRTQVGKADLI
ncbi:MAG TPA: PEP-CTERM sorting domain-containing protein [Longimicrobiales bacterium]